jgi:WD repeat-containing protein 23
MLYDTSDPFNWREKSSIAAQHISWTVTDMDVDPQEQFLIYSSIDPYIRLVDLETLQRKQEFLNLSESGEDEYHRGSGIMSCKFSGDGKQIVCGTKAAEVLLYDLVSGRLVTKVSGAH